MTTPIYIRTQNFLSKAKLKHNKYDYSLVKYIDAKTKVKIICTIHGEFTQTPNSHLNGSGCYSCGLESRINKLSSNTKEFIYKSNKIHKNKYDYSLSKYKNNYTKIKIICPIHGEFNQTPSDHINKQGCNECGICSRSIKNKYNKNLIGIYTPKRLLNNHRLANKNSTLYIIEHENLTKIGVTIQHIHKRFNKSINILHVLTNIPLFDSFTSEQEILKKYKIYRHIPINWKHKGDTEFLKISPEQRNQIIIDYFIEV